MTTNSTYPSHVNYGLNHVIEINPSKNEIIKILCQDYVKSGNIDKCFTGSITRLINALNGFDQLVIINLEPE